VARFTVSFNRSPFPLIDEYAISEFKPSAINESIRMTKREKQLIELIADGSTNKEIALKLNLSDSYKTAIDATSLINEKFVSTFHPKDVVPFSSFCLIYSTNTFI